MSRLLTYSILQQRIKNFILKYDAGNINSYPGSGTDVFDLSQNKNDGTLTNVQYSSQFGGYFLFDGNGDYIDSGNKDSLKITELSISLWFLAGVQPSTYRAIIAKKYGYNIFINSNLISIYDYKALIFRDTTINASDFVWRHIVVTFSEMSGTPSNNVNVYVDSENKLTTTAGVGLPDNYNLLFGNASGESQYFFGGISKAVIYNKILSQDEINKIYNTEKSRYELGSIPSGYPSGLKYLWKLEETSGNNVIPFYGTVLGKSANCTLNQTGKVGKCYSFNGTSSYIVFENIGLTTFSISLWYYIATGHGNANYDRIFGMTGYRFELAYYGTGFAIYDGAWHTGLGSFTLDTWHHLVITKDTLGYVFYVNNSAVYNPTKSLTINTTDALYIGSTVGPTSYISGLIDQISYYNVKLDSTAVSLLYNSGNGI